MNGVQTAHDSAWSPESGDRAWSLVREWGIDYRTQARAADRGALRFPVYAERGRDGSFLIVDDLSIGKYLAHSTRCRTIRVGADGELLFDSVQRGMADAYGCFFGGEGIALIARSGSELRMLGANGAIEHTIELSSFSKGLPRLLCWTWRDSFLVQFIIRTGQIDIVEISPDGRLLWYLPRLPTLDIGFPGSIELLRNGHLLLVDEFHHQALEVGRDGRIVWRYGRRDHPSLAPDCLANPKSVCAGVERDRLIADTRNHRVLRIAADGSVGELCAADGDFCTPSFVKPSIDRRYLVCDAGNGRVLELDPAGRTVWQYGTALGSKRRLSYPRSVEIYKQGYLMADTANDRVLHLQGDAVTEVCSKETSGLFWPRCARSTPSGSLLIADARNSRILEVSPDGGNERELASSDLPSELALRDPHDVSLLQDGHLLLVDASADRVIECSWSGAVRRVLGNGEGGLELGDPHSAQALPQRHLLLSDTRNNRIVHVDDAGRVVRSFEAFRTGAGYLRLFRPRYAECTPDGIMVVADSDNNRILAANLDGELIWELSHIPDSPLPRIHQPRWVHAVNREEIVISDHLHHRIVHLRRS